MPPSGHGSHGWAPGVPCARVGGLVMKARSPPNLCSALHPGQRDAPHPPATATATATADRPHAAWDGEEKVKSNFTAVHLDSTRFDTKRRDKPAVPFEISAPAVHEISILHRTGHHSVALIKCRTYCYTDHGPWQLLCFFRPGFGDGREFMICLNLAIYLISGMMSTFKPSSKCCFPISSILHT